ncbi:hypothetical protein HO173_010813 [Letharia columbiana]|uniref:MT-A70-domain-containing protein n=1 Tax=Letharia columbiana TaxID=112416 RepID=A0A8H6FLT3_9LECA|nr:uncharacterized protein HO173_010813 [Letharia columbiana]KAF6230905.1 hypothetical protein HO173_010813 [Letharia columbiana]
MAEQISTPTPILYQNPTKTLTLLDIPTSIAHAQGTVDHPCNDQICASPPLQTPYPSTEPKTEKAKANVLRTKTPSDTDVGFPDALLQQALREVAEHWPLEEDWCLPRKITSLVSERQSRKRKADDAIDQVFSTQKRDSVHASTAVLPASKIETEIGLDPSPSRTEPDFKFPDSEISVRSIEEPLILSSESTPKAYTCSDIRIFTNRLVRNPYPTLLSLQCSGVKYKTPPNANFLLSKIGEPTAHAFSMAALTLYPKSSATAGPGQFDFVLLDPPWENRSVRRSARYDTMHDSDPMVVLQAMLGQHIAPGALVGCWITNKASVRDTALDAFQTWDVQLIEEWAWLKTTVGGLPITQIDGLWRKPYEVLLLGRKGSDEAQSSDSDVRRRVVVAVPDLHSRKPHLKTLIEPFIPASYRALEVFARNLTAEWWSWGDEVLKYNWDGHWYTHKGSTQIYD